MFSPVTRRNVLRIIPFGFIWLVFSLIYSLLERGLLGNLHVYPATGNPYHFGSTIFITAIIAFTLGLLIGSVEVFYLNRLFIHQTFFKKILYKTAIYLAIIILFLLINTVINNAVLMDVSVFSKMPWRNTWLFFSNYAFWSVEIYIAAIIGISLFFTEVNDNLGQGILNNFFTGKYHRPKVEERIFMFLDMKSSTTIAEHIGHVRYFDMLKAYFSDLSAPVIKYSGEIYQYVGDEVVVSWKLNTGLFNNNCIRCFFAMQAALEKQSSKYIERFGLAPGFKAGFHYGKVTTGEIGVIKKEIIFTGDVLNTTARIQGLCNEYNTDILVSGQLVKQLNPGHSFRFTSLGETQLKGRDESVELFTISMNAG